MVHTLSKQSVATHTHTHAHVLHATACCSNTHTSRVSGLIDRAGIAAMALRGRPKGEKNRDGHNAGREAPQTPPLAQIPCSQHYITS